MMLWWQINNNLITRWSDDQIIVNSYIFGELTSSLIVGDIWLELCYGGKITPIVGSCTSYISLVSATQISVCLNKEKWSTHLLLKTRETAPCLWFSHSISLHLSFHSFSFSHHLHPFHRSPSFFFFSHLTLLSWPCLSLTPHSLICLPVCGKHTPIRVAGSAV